MSIRICYVERSGRGSTIRRLRLVGQTTESVFPAGLAPEASLIGHADPTPGVEPVSAAAWISDQLGALRSTTTLAMLCLDTDGAACTWLSSPSTDPSVLNIIARYGATTAISASGDSGDGPRGNAAVDFYAPSTADSSIQALADAQQDGTPKPRPGFASRFKGQASLLPGASTIPAQAVAEAAGKSANASAEAAAQRLPIIAFSDVPGRLLIDSLDERSIPVETVTSLWHAMAQAWDPSWDMARTAKDAASAADPLRTVVAPSTVATIILDPRGKLLWTWSKACALLVSGSMRLRVHAAPGTIPGGPGAPPTDDTASTVIPIAPCLTFGQDDVTRLTAEWLAWSAQTGLAPDHITLIATNNDPAMVAEFGEALTRSWKGATLDAAMVADPVSATLQRLADRLEQTPDSPAAHAPTAALVSLAGRRGREHRKLYIWSSVALASAALLTFLIASRFRALASEATSAARATSTQVADVIKDNFPDIRPGLGPSNSIVAQSGEQVRKLQALAEPAKRTEPPIPILDELETLSMVVGNSQYALERLELEASTTAQLKLEIVADSPEDVEAMTKALDSIAGSHARWKEPSTYDTRTRPGKVLVRYTAMWVLPPAPAAPAAPR